MPLGANRRVRFDDGRQRRAGLVGRGAACYAEATFLCGVKGLTMNFWRGI